jgi:hypothetical protein
MKDGGKEKSMHALIVAMLVVCFYNWSYHLICLCACLHAVMISANELTPGIKF